jgi:hypothetical protein
MAEQLNYAGDSRPLFTRHLQDHFGLLAWSSRPPTPAKWQSKALRSPHEPSHQPTAASKTAREHWSLAPLSRSGNAWEARRRATVRVA